MRSKPCPCPREGSCRRSFAEEFNRDTVQLLPDGHAAQSRMERLGMSSSSLLTAGSVNSWNYATRRQTTAGTKEHNGGAAKPRRGHPGTAPRMQPK
jgi:hypothetical protein